jgi:hypothetical protein
MSFILAVILLLCFPDLVGLGICLLLLGSFLSWLF